ncbi:MAG: hypothetical protein AMXMBFR7_06000 [Planctomycetota bacterium]
MSEPHADELPEAFRDEVALLAMGAMLPEEAEALQRRLAADPRAKELYVTYQTLWARVREESELRDGELPDGERVLQRLRKQIAEESRSALKPVPPPAAPPARRTGIWFAAFLLLAVAAFIGVGIAFGPAGGHPPHPPGPKPEPPLATVEPLPGEERGEALRANETFTAREDGQRIQLDGGVDVRLRAGSSITLRSAHEMILESGEAAVRWPAARKDFTLQAGRMKVRSAGDLARFVLRREPEELLLAEGRATAAAGTTERTVAAGQAAALNETGLLELRNDAGVDAASSWVVERFAKSLELTLRLEPRAPGGPVLATIVLRNTGSQVLGVPGYHELGVNFGLQVRASAQDAPAFTKVLPRKLRKRLAPDLAEELTPSRVPVTLHPGESYELELDLRTVLPASSTPAHVAAHYLYRSDPAEAGSWGITLQSAECEVLAAP